MIPKSFIEEQIKMSKDEKKTSYFIRRFAFQVVDKALRKHYGDNYSIRCLQSSAGIQKVLTHFGIISRLFTGALCLIEIANNNGAISWAWSGFWDKDHHIFLSTEYHDLVDLTISQLYLHPSSKFINAFPIPPFWWTPNDKWPPLIKYLPEAPIKVELPNDEMNDYNNFLITVDEVKEEYLSNLNVDDIAFAPIVYGIESLNLLTEMKDPWLVWSKYVVDRGIEYPEWISLKEELNNRYKNKKRI